MVKSLHARMLALSAVATLVALALAGWAMTSILERFVITGLDRRLDAEVALLASAVDASGRIDQARLRQRLAAFADGPGWRWRIIGPDGAVGSQDFPALDSGPPRPPMPPGPAEAAGAPPPIPDDDRLHPLEGASEDGVTIHARQLTIRTARGPVTLTAAAPRSVILSPIRGALVPLMATLVALALLLGTAALVQLRIGLHPVRRLRDQVAAIRRGTRDRVDEDQPSELRPLAAELNALAADSRAALASARLAAANLAHALKTPVATLALDVRDEPAYAAQVARIDATIRHHLARARVETVDRRAITPLAPAVDDLVATVRRLHADRVLSFDVMIPDDLAIAIDPRDCDEMIGNLLDNAARHAAGQVTIMARRAAADARQVTVEIGDDGPGIPQAERSHVMEPGRRLDEDGDGHGFGLGIVKELVSLYGGRMTLSDKDGHGLLVTLSLPAPVA